MRHRHQCILSLFLIIFFWHSYGQAETYTLIIKVSGGEPNTGQAVISLFDSEENYLKSPKHFQSTPMDGNGEARCSINDLAAGRYAVSVAYDEDSNGELNTGFMGIPTELVGFSNNAKSSFGPPSFEKSSFDLEASKSISIQLGNAKD